MAWMPTTSSAFTSVDCKYLGLSGCCLAKGVDLAGAQSRTKGRVPGPLKQPSTDD